MRFGLQWITNQMTRPQQGFSAASQSESIVFGASRPGFPLPTVSAHLVEQWIAFMLDQHIQRIVCLLPERQLGAYTDLLERYRQTWGTTHILWSPIPDFHLAKAQQLRDHILPFLSEAEQHQQKVVVHCSAGRGRTGHVLAAWLVSHRGMTNQQAIDAVRQQGRNAREARDPGLDNLLDQCRDAYHR